jgi:hypothetical protein
MLERDPEMKKGVQEQIEYRGPAWYWFSFYIYFICLWWIVLPIMAFIYIHDALCGKPPEAPRESEDKEE